MSVVVDTDVASYLFKRDTRGALYEPHLYGIPKFISFMTVAEMRRWALGRNWGAKRHQKLEDFLAGYGVIYADDELCNMWAKAVDSARRNGKPVDTADAWVAAVALKFAVPLVTHNRTHFEGVEGLTIISETK